MNRPRFSLRTLAIVVTLICAYFGAWEATKKYGVPDRYKWVDLKQFDEGKVDRLVWTGKSPAPFVVCQDEIHRDFLGKRRRGYYLWLFGQKVELPYESLLEW